jgi:dipeptidyl aminopeptidase/acylaminoacyl peptidase
VIRFRNLVILAFAAAALPACGRPIAPASSPPTAVAAVASPTAPPTATITPSATLTPTPSATSTATPSATPTPHPMSIAAMRQRQYPGSDIVIESELEPGVNYRRYYASYLSEGLKIYALLTLPNGERPAEGWPAIVFNHGFIPPAQYRTTQRYVAYVDTLARNGYIVLRSDYRGHDQSEGEARGAYGDPGYTVDVINAVTSLQRFAEADPNSIGMWGHSMGGYLTLRSMVINPDIKAGVIWAGVVAPYPDLFARGANQPTPAPTGSDVTLTPSPGRGWRGAWIRQFGTPDENPEFWNSISSNTFLHHLSGPLQLHHGTADTSVPLAASETLYQQMLAAGQPVEFYTYEGDNHNLSGFFSTAMLRTVAFFDQHLKGD